MSTMDYFYSWFDLEAVLFQMWYKGSAGLMADTLYLKDLEDFICKIL